MQESLKEGGGVGGRREEGGGGEEGGWGGGGGGGGVYTMNHGTLSMGRVTLCSSAVPEDRRTNKTRRPSAPLDLLGGDGVRTDRRVRATLL